jgi:hypothetical protein
MQYLTSAEKNELKRLKTMADEIIHIDEEFWDAKSTSSSFIGYWGEEGAVGFGFGFIDPFSYCSQ